MEKVARKVQPKIIICGYSAYSRTIDFQKFRYQWSILCRLSLFHVRVVRETPFRMDQRHCDRRRTLNALGWQSGRRDRCPCRTGQIAIGVMVTLPPKRLWYIRDRCWLAIQHGSLIQLRLQTDYGSKGVCQMPGITWNTSEIARLVVLLRDGHPIASVGIGNRSTAAVRNKAARLSLIGDGISRKRWYSLPFWPLGRAPGRPGEAGSAKNVYPHDVLSIWGILGNREPDRETRNL